MRTTVEIPDDLFRQAKAAAALQGRSLKDLVADGLKLALQDDARDGSRAVSRRTVFPLINAKDPARKVTPEMVASAEEKLIVEEAAAHGRLAGH